MKKTATTALTIQSIILLYTLVAWIVNLVKFIQCDFAEPYKEEILRLAGVVMPPVSWVMAWISF